MSADNLFEGAPTLPPWVGQLARYLGAAWPNWKPTAATMVVYFDALRDIGPKCIGIAARNLVREAREFAPSAGEVRAEALKVRKEAKPHAEDCACTACLNALPVSERWLRMSPMMRTQLEREQPETASALKAAVPPQVLERVAGVRRLLGFTRPVPPEPTEPSGAGRLERFMRGAGDGST